MKKITLLLIMILISSSLVAQKKKRNAKANFKVDGVCMMCKKRIEKATLVMKGVKYAIWDVHSHDLHLIIDERKTTITEIKKKVASIGHDTDEFTAPDEAYDSLHACCKYRSQEVQQNHQ